MVAKLEKEYLQDFTGTTASITDKRDGTARLVIKAPQGLKVVDKVYKSHAAAKSAWNRYCK